jgi:hypothetical protein
MVNGKSLSFVVESRSSWVHTMMRPRTIRVTAILLILAVCLAAFAGWDIVYERFVTAEWPAENHHFF